MQNKIGSVTIVGAGNVGWHLATLLKNCNISIHRIVSRNANKAKILATGVQADWSDRFDCDLPDDTLVIVSVNDSVIPEILKQFKQPVHNLVHVSGSIPMNIMKHYAINFGVFYPFQTFTQGVEIVNKHFPICIEASNEGFRETLSDLAGKITDKVININSEKRKKLHLAGITINNFTNHLVVLASDYLDSNKIDAKILLPLLFETIEKAGKGIAHESQTGPARRGNQKIIEDHVQMLEKNLALQKIYKTISESIIGYYNEQ